MEIPLFPLHVVLCPGVVLPLHIFEPRYRAMIGRCLDEEAPFGVVCISAGREVGASTVEFASVGTLAEIREVTRHPDGRLDILTVGSRRFRVRAVAATPGDYLVGTADVLDEPLGDEAHARRLARRASDRFIRYLDLLQDGTPSPVDESADDATRAVFDVVEEADEVARPATGRSSGTADAAPDIATPDDPTALAHVLVGLVRIELARRQRLLEAASTEDRLVELNRVLRGEIALLERQLVAYVPDGSLLAGRRN